MSADSDRHLWFMIGEVLVAESKWEITAEKAVAQIRQYTREAERKGRAEMADWITDKLPPEDEEVIVTVRDDSGDSPFTFVTSAWYYGGIWISDNHRVCGEVIAWQPMPEAYKGGAEHE